MLFVFIDTYSELVEYNESLLLLEKCNILSAYEKSIPNHLIKDYRDQYTLRISTNDSSKSYAFESKDYDSTYWDEKDVSLDDPNP